MFTVTRTSLQSLGQRVAEAGVDADPTALADLVAAASTAGVSPVLTQVLLDPQAPPVARLRAFERISCGVARAIYTPTRSNVAIAA